MFIKKAADLSVVDGGEWVSWSGYRGRRRNVKLAHEVNDGHSRTYFYTPPLCIPHDGPEIVAHKADFTFDLEFWILNSPVWHPSDYVMSIHVFCAFSPTG